MERQQTAFEHDSRATGAVKRARRLRPEMPLSEKLLWEELRKLKLNIRRQAPMGRYTADFIHHGARLVIEVDSPYHDDPERQLRDAKRDEWFASQGYRTFRIRDGQVFKDPEALASSIGDAIKNSNLPPQWGEGRVGGVSAGGAEEARPAPNADLSARPVATPPSPTLPPLRGKGV